MGRKEREINYSAIALLIVAGLLVYHKLLAHKRKIRYLEEQM